MRQMKSHIATVGARFARADHSQAFFVGRGQLAAHIKQRRPVRQTAEQLRIGVVFQRNQLGPGALHLCHFSCKVDFAARSAEMPQQVRWQVEAHQAGIRLKPQGFRRFKMRHEPGEPGRADIGDEAQSQPILLMF